MSIKRVIDSELGKFGIIFLLVGIVDYLASDIGGFVPDAGRLGIELDVGQVLAALIIYCLLRLAMNRRVFG